jgi:hypothetical protein
MSVGLPPNLPANWIDYFTSLRIEPLAPQGRFMLGFNQQIAIG